MPALPASRFVLGSCRKAWIRYAPNDKTGPADAQRSRVDAALRTSIMGAPKPRILAYELPGQWTVLAGASDEDNDYLSTELAEPNDWWFHADKVPGSHVILRVKEDEEPSAETIRQAAAIAAYHSKARNAGIVPVHCARARSVSKPRGVKSGTVNVRHGKTLKVRPDISFAVRRRWQG